MIKSLAHLVQEIAKGQQFEIFDTKSGEWVPITISEDEAGDFWEAVEISGSKLCVKQIKG